MFKKTGLFVVILSFLALLEPRSSQAQEIKIDGNTATIVTKDGDRITIDGNTLSRDGKNLFHSFQEFGLSQQQIATFLTNPNIQNILTRVTGGNPSYINGLIQVVGGNSNLFLMNPAGVVFGSGASINVPADFTATTATGIGFNNGVFSAVGSNDYSNLTGNPTNFVFNTNQPGSIINAGDLKVSEGSNINLIGGNVINTGSIETPNGKINIQAVAGTSRVKITPEGSLLSLEIEIPSDEKGNVLGFTPQDLPTLLTGAHNAGVATPNVTVNNNQVQVANVNIPEGTGSSIVSGNISTSSESLGGEITVLGERVGVIEGEITANGAQGGGKVLIGGDFQGKGSIPNAQTTVVNKNSTITANAINNGDGGEVIVWADGNTSFTGNIEAKGGINGGDGGFVEVSGKENLNFNGLVDTTANKGNIGTVLLDPLNVIISSVGTDDAQIIADGEILAGDGGNANFNISQNALQNLAGITDVVIEATNNITITELVGNTLTFQSNITTGDQPRTSVTFRANADGIGGGDFSMNPEHTIIARGRDVIISGENITVGAINTSTPLNTNGNGGNITLNAANNIRIQGTTTATGETPTPFSLGSFVSVGGVGNAGNINLTSANGSISITPDNGNIIANTPSGNAGNIQLNAPNGNVNLPSNIRFVSFSNSNNTGNVTLTGNNIQPSGANSTVDFVVRNEVNLNTNNLNVGINNTFNLNPLINVNSSNNLTINQNINTNGGELNARANGSILVNDGVAINSNGGNVTLNSNRNSLNGGSITMNSGSSITANGGDIILGGGADPLNNPAIGVAAGANLNDRNYGILLNSATLETNGTGFISLRGTGFTGNGNDNPGNDNPGIGLQGNTIIRTLNGDITLVGIGQASGERNHGIGFGSPGVANETITIESTGTGNINLEGIHQGNGTGSIGIIMTGDNSDNLSRITSNTGSITLTGRTNGTNTIGAISGGVSLLSNSQVNSTNNGLIDFNSINIEALSENTNNGLRVIGNARIVGANILNIDTGSSDVFIDPNSPSDFGEVRIRSARNAILNDINGVILRQINVTGDLTVNANGDITGIRDVRVLTVGGTTSLNANGNNINLAGRDTFGGTNDFNILEIVNAQDVLISDNNSLILGNSNVTGNLTITTQGAITNNGVVVVGGTTNLNPNNNDVILDNINNDFNRIGIENGNNVTLADINDVILENVDALGNPANFQIAGDLDLRVAGITTINSNIQADSLITDSNGSTIINADSITTNLNQTYNDPVILAKDTQLDGNNITFNSSIDGTQSLTVNSIGEGETTFNEDVGSVTPLTDLTTNADGETILNGNITTSGSQTYNDAVTLDNNVILTTTNSSIKFANTVNSQQESNNNLTVNTGSGDITFNNALGNNQSLGDVKLNSTGTTSLNAVNATSITTNEGGTTRLNANVTTSGSQTYKDGVTLDNNVTLTTTNSSIEFANIVNSATNKNLKVETGSGNISFNNAIESLGDVELNSTGTTSLNAVNATSITTNEGGTTRLNANVTTSGSQTYKDVVTLDNNVILTTTNSSIEFANTVNSASNNNLKVETGSGDISFNNGIESLGDVRLNSSGTTSLNAVNANSLTINEGGTTRLNANVTTSGSQTYNDGVTLDNNVTLTTTNSSIEFGNTVNSQQESNNNLTVETGSGDITFNNALGNNQSLGDVKLNSTGTTSLNAVNATSITTNEGGTTRLNANVTTSGSQTYKDAVTLDNNVTLTTTNSSIEFGNTVNSQQESNNNLTVETGSGDITFNNALGNNQSLGDVKLNSTGTTSLNAVNATSITTNEGGTTRLNANVTTSGSQTYKDVVTLDNNVTLTTTDSSIEFANTVNSASNNNLKVETGSGDISFNNGIESLGDVRLNSSGTTSLNAVDANSLTTNEGGTTRLNANVTTSGSQTYNDGVTLDNNVILTTTNSSIKFANTFNSATSTNNNLTVNTGNSNITFSGSIGDTQALGNIELNNTKTTRLNTITANSLKTNEGGTTRLNGNVTTSGNQVYQDNLFLDTSTLIKTNNLTAVSIEANNKSTSPISLTIDASDSVTITGKPDANSLLAISTARKNNQETGNITINANNDINLLGAVNTTATSGTSFATTAGDISFTSTNGDVSALAIASIGTETSGNVTISGDNIDTGTILTFLNPTNVTTGNINIQGNTTTVSGTIQGFSLTALGTFTLAENPAILALPNANLARLGNASVNTINDQNYNNFNLLNNATLNSIQGQINFTGGVSANSNDLSIRSLTGVNFANQNFTSEGGNLAITTFNPVGTVFVGNGDGSQFVVKNLDRTNGFDSITIGQNRNFGTITINENLTVNDPLTLQASNIFVNNTISGNDNASITLTGAKTTTTLNADIITQGNDITIDDNVILGNNVTLSTGNGDTGNIDILGSINGNNNLTLNAGSSSISLTDNISLNNFSVTANNTVFKGNSITTTGNQNFDSNLTLTNNTNFNSQGTFSAQNISGIDTDVAINAPSISTQNIVTEGGNISMISSEGAVSTQNLDTSGTTGGSIDINSNTTINTADIQTIGSNGDAGNVTLTAQNDLEIDSINVSSNNGQGGDVNISTLGRLRVTDTIDNTNISINATGTNGGGAITIDFFPDNSQTGKTSDPRLPFVVGNPNSNGTKGIITNGEFSISPDQYFEVVEEGNINVRLLEPKPTQPPKPPTSVDTRREKLDILKTDGDTNNSIEPPPETPPQIATVLPSVVPITTISQGQEILTQIERQVAEKPAFIYVSFTPKGFQPRDLEAEFARREATNTQEYSRVNINKPNLQPTIALKPAEDDQLDLLVITSQGEPIRVIVPVTRQQVVDSALNLSIELSSDRLDEQYKPYAKELYSWLITPIEETLKEREISNLLFILPLNIRFVPIASLYDEKTEQFLVEKYSSGLAPSLNLNDNTYRSLKDLNLLAMGAATFAKDQQQTPLPAVSLELPTIKTIWNEQSSDNYQEFLNDNFTLETIKANLDKQPYGIIHFGTHGSFGADEDEDIFIQLYNSRLNFKDIGSIGLNRSGIELMLLSACQTALGNDIAELGFAGLAVQAGVKSAIGTVWTIGDTGTLAFMTDFYGELKTQTTKAEALRQTQLNMLNGKVYKSDDGNTIITPNKSVSLEGLPEDSRQPENLSHPFYWAPFTLIGNPW